MEVERPYESSNTNDAGPWFELVGEFRLRYFLIDSCITAKMR